MADLHRCGGGGGELHAVPALQPSRPSQRVLKQQSSDESTAAPSSACGPLDVLPENEDHPAFLFDLEIARFLGDADLETGLDDDDADAAGVSYCANRGAKEEACG